MTTYTREELNKMTGPELVKIYNKHAKKPIKKFATKKIGVVKTLGVLPKRATSGKGTAKKVKASRKKSTGSRWAYEPTATIKKLVDENPRRNGSKGAENWKLYRNGMTIEQYAAALEKAGNGVDMRHLHWDVDKGFISVK